MEELGSVYARALFEVARDRDTLDEVHQQLGEFADAIEDSRDMQVFFFSPYFDRKDKEEGLDKVLTGADESFRNFLGLLIEKHRMPALMRIRRAFDRLWEEHNRLLPVQVTSAVELDKRKVEEIGSKISEQTGRKVELSSNVEPDILGGLVVRVGNAVLDASVRHRLDQLRREVARAR